jgi:hypothetical protein
MPEEEDAKYLVIEDDVLPGAEGDMTSKICALDFEYDIAFLGLPTPTGDAGGVPIQSGLVVATDSYLITRSAAKKLVEAFAPMRWAFHVHLSYLMHVLGLRAFAVRPNIFADGSKVGYFTSSINANNILHYNGAYIEARGLLDAGGALKEEDDKRVKELLEKSEIKDASPDFALLRARYAELHGDYDEAKRLYDAMFDAYLRTGAMMSGASTWLKSYSGVHSHTQLLPCGGEQQPSS